MFVNSLVGMFVGAFPYDPYLSNQLASIDVKRVHAAECHLCDFVGYRVCFVQHLMITRRGSRPRRALACPLVSLALKL